MPELEPRSKPDAAKPDAVSRDTPIDDAIRRALDGPSQVEQRIVRRALHRGRPRRGVGLRGWLPAAAAACCAVVLAVWLISLMPRSTTAPVQPAARPTASIEPPSIGTQPPTLHISNEGGFVAVSTQAGIRWIVISGDPS